jgi:hypothetical protein
LVFQFKRGFYMAFKDKTSEGPNFMPVRQGKQPLDQGLIGPPHKRGRNQELEGGRNQADKFAGS